ncbi:MAG TPA: CYTH domain-containing protein [Desulfobulbus sp.]|nr:CYTH domain-containing protein [Desulfobulbus sp.]
MAIEIERKFLLRNDSWRQSARGRLYRQGYIMSGSGVTVRVRTVEEKGFLTIKGKSRGAARAEYEYPIPLTDAREMLETLCTGPLIEKMRYLVEYEGFTWEIDEFAGENQGLIVAEIELSSEVQEFPRPPWLGREVTGDGRYFNASLARNPYRRWPR